MTIEERIKLLRAAGMELPPDPDIDPKAVERIEALPLEQFEELIKITQDLSPPGDQPPRLYYNGGGFQRRTYED